MTNRANEYLTQRPLLGAVAFVGMVAVASLVWTMILERPRSLPSVLTDGGVWLSIGLVALPAGVVYFVVASRT